MYFTLCTLRSQWLRGLMIFILAGPLTAANASVRVSIWPAEAGSTFPVFQYVEIYGTIESADVQSLNGYLLNPKIHIIGLNSVGGNVDAAMGLGRILRQSDKKVLVNAESVCISACVFTLAGATNRDIRGKVGIHRPYFPFDTATDSKQQKANYGVIEATIKSYLNEMNVNVALYDDMFRISPSNIRFLTREELEKYGMTDIDPYVEEALVTSLANEMHLSKGEYLRREARIKTECNLRQPTFGVCATAIQYGISVEEYNRREALAVVKCKGSENRISYVRCERLITRGF